MSDEIFLRVRSETGRDAFKLFCERQGLSITDEAAKAAFREWAPLRDPALVSYCLDALASARGPVADGDRPFPLMIWENGAEHTHFGRPSKESVAAFAHMLRIRGTAVAPKRTGWVVEPTDNSDGHRTNESTTAVHALFLDCDGTGEWDALLAHLARLDLFHVAYQSGGWAPGTPKWRVVLPLAAPFDTRGEHRQELWKAFYRHCRTALGAAAGLASVGFDPATDPPCNPWFLTERRDPAAPARAVAWRPGHLLDAVGLMLALPPPPIATVAAPDLSEVEDRVLSAEEIVQLVKKLAAATVHIPANRRDLYLSLPAALLDRGVDPDAVLAVCEAVSASYPRHHPELHADNVHCAKTTVAKWLKDGRVTRIGTLNSLLPSVAAVVDELLPDRLRKMLEESVEAQLRTHRAAVAADAAAATTPRRPRVARGPLAKRVAALIKRLSKNKKNKDQNKLVTDLLTCLLEGAPITGKTAQEVDNLLAIAVGKLGQSLPNNTLWAEVLDFASQSLLSTDVTQSIARVSALARAFAAGQDKRRGNQKKKQKQSEDTRLLRANDAQKCLL